MSRLTVEQLVNDLASESIILHRLRGGDTEYRDIIAAMLILKRASDQPGFLEVPEGARWSALRGYQGGAPETAIAHALGELEQSNPEVLGGVLARLHVSEKLHPADFGVLMEHFDRIPLGDEDLEFNDVIGRAYDQVLGWSAVGDVKGGGEFFTPRSVIRLMVDLVRPEAGQSIYDPFAGTGGMLVAAREYVEERKGEGGDLVLAGQELNRYTWAIGRLNLLFHGLPNDLLLHGDTLADPLHRGPDETVERFDRVLTNPPFSLNYPARKVNFPELMAYGEVSGKGRADLMNVQHVLATLRPDGIGAMITPHGVLFRAGTEGAIRRRIVEDGRLDAVIGIGPNVFYGTSIPACILVLRGTDRAPEQRDQVLFINAEYEVVTGRTQNYLDPQHVEKIAEVFRERTDVPGFSRLVPLAELAENEYDLNIRRYVDASPPAEPLVDVQTALFGGAPRREIEAEAPRFRRFGIEVAELFQPKGPDSLDFLAEGYEATAADIPRRAAVREREFVGSLRSWTKAAEGRIAALANAGQLVRARSELMTSFSNELLKVGVLDRYQLTGIFATWWSWWQDEFRSLDRWGFAEVTGRREPTKAADEARERLLVEFSASLGGAALDPFLAERQRLVDVFLRWGDRYATSLRDLEAQSEAAAARLRSRLRELGYA